MKLLVLFLCCSLNLYGLNAVIIGVEVRNEYIYACGDEFMETNCKCTNAVLNCDSNGLSDANIHIIAENFTVKIAKFRSNEITVLKKKQILPGREYNIQTLSFFRNSISSIDNGTFDEFRNLKELDLSYNKLSKIDENVLTKSLGKTLVHLNLNMNQLKEITPKTFIFLKKLEFLGLSDNTALMPYFNKNVFSKSLSNLKILDLTWCNITTLQDDDFVNLVKLEKIHLYKNPFTTVPKALNLLPNLQHMDLSHTGLTSFNKDDLKFNSKLGSKKLTFLHQNAFGSFSTGKLYSNLKEFNIAETNISTISEKLFDWSKAIELYLGTNGYNCDCLMAWLINDLENPIRKKNINYFLFQSTSPKCSNLPELRGKNFSEIVGKICDGKVSSLYSNSHPSTSNLFQWFLFGGTIFGIAILCYIYQNQIIHFINRYRNSHRDDTDQLFQYRNLEDDSVSM